MSELSPPPPEFFKIMKDFLNDILITFPEYEEKITELQTEFDEELRTARQRFEKEIENREVELAEREEALFEKACQLMELKLEHQGKKRLLGL